MGRVKLLEQFVKAWYYGFSCACLPCQWLQKEYKNGFERQFLMTKMESKNKLFTHLERQVGHP